jgi:hypothetical protein
MEINNVANMQTFWCNDDDKQIITNWHMKFVVLTNMVVLHPIRFRILNYNKPMESALDI